MQKIFEKLQKQPGIAILDKKDYGNAYAIVLSTGKKNEIYVIWTTSGIHSLDNGFANRSTDARCFAIQVNQFVPLSDPAEVKDNNIINLYSMPYTPDDIMAYYRSKLRKTGAWNGTFIGGGLLPINQLPFFTQVAA